MRLTAKLKRLERELGGGSGCPCGGRGLFVVLLPGRQPGDPTLPSCVVCGKRRVIGVRERAALPLAD